MFKVTEKETSELVTNCDRFRTLKHSSSTPYAFTEHGIAMLSSVLNSERAITINIEIIVALNNLIEQPPKAKKIGFGVNEKAPGYLNKHFSYPIPKKP